MTIPGFDLEPAAQRVLFGTGTVHELGAELERLGRIRPLVLCSWRRRRSDEFAHLAGGLGLTPPVFQGAEEHVPRLVVEAAWRAVQEHEADSVISFGGGSAVDLGKAVVFVARRGMEAMDAVTAAAVPNTDGASDEPGPVAHVAVPTTYSGAEATSCFFVSDRQEKRVVSGAGIRPDVVVADPSMTFSLPWKPTGGTGMTALANCLEGLTSSRRSHRSDALAAGAARSLVSLLPVLSREPDREKGRGDMLAAAYVAGVVSDLVGKGLHQTLCTGIGARTGAPHGVAGAILLPHVIRFDLDAAHDGVSRFAEAIGERDPARAAEAVQAIAWDLGLPKRLREVGVFNEDLGPVARWAAGRPELRRVPWAVSEEDALAILLAAW